jgi:hypothetical protein
MFVIFLPNIIWGGGSSPANSSRRQRERKVEAGKDS